MSDMIDTGNDLAQVNPVEFFEQANAGASVVIENGQRFYRTQGGELLPLRAIPAMVIRQLNSDESGKPQPPIVTVKIGGKTSKEVNDNDPDYKAALEQWDRDRNERIMMYVLVRGVALEPEPDDQERLLEFSPGLTKSRLKYTWVLEKLSGEIEMAELMSVIMGQTVPTETGIRAAEEQFPGTV